MSRFLHTASDKRMRLGKVVSAFNLENEFMPYPSHTLTRRSVLVLLPAVLVDLPLSAHATGLPVVTVTRDPNCGCCEGWITHLKQAGFPVAVNASADMASRGARLGVPPELGGCHTGEVAGYVVEGHVPADAILRLLAEKPDAIGVAVPGMPVGSPGMEGGEPVSYGVTLFGRNWQRNFGTYVGTQRT
jgi:hypothetical protein